MEQGIIRSKSKISDRLVVGLSRAERMEVYEL